MPGIESSAKSDKTAVSGLASYMRILLIFFLQYEIIKFAIISFRLCLMHSAWVISHIRDSGFAIGAGKVVVYVFVCFLLIAVLFSFNKILADKAGKKLTIMLLFLNLTFAVSVLSSFYIRLDMELSNYVEIGDNVFLHNPDTQTPVTFNNRTTITRINSSGTRACPYALNKKTPDIAIAGDSFVYGVLLNDDETLCAGLGKSIEAKTGEKRNIVNIAFPGINLSSMVRTADVFMNKKPPEWVIIGFHSGVFRHCDTFCRLRLERESGVYLMISFLIGIDALSNAVQIYNNHILSSSQEAEYTAFKNQINNLAKKTRVLIFSYQGDSQFLQELRRNNNIYFVYYNLDDSNPLFKDLIIPNEIHPNAKANEIFGGVIADYIIGMEGKSRKGAR